LHAQLAFANRYVYRGSPGPLAVISLGNLANVSLLSPAIPGPEQYLAGRPMLAVTVIFVQIVVTLVLVGVFARRNTVAARASRGSAVKASPAESPGDPGPRRF
jgi:heme/copper-type cytochrome/quinol oxidase subunit 2